jgi:guanine nucleotide-binding protein subunit alpha
MKLIYSQGFTKNEKLEWKPVIFNNIIQSFKLIAEAMREHDLQFDSPDNEVGQFLLPFDFDHRDFTTFNELK